jgi:3-methyl-2-oxobutanoate hydroxymethyltransferase
MSYLNEGKTQRMTVKSIKQLKGSRPIVALTAYDALFTRLVDPFIDLLLVGDSVGNTFLGYADTVSVTLETMLHHTAAVNRARPHALLVADLPFSLAYESPDALLGSCRRLVQEGGAQAIKIEVGHPDLFPKIERLIAAGIPIMGHIGLLPQNIHALGSYRSYGNRETGKRRLMDWALQLQAVGCFSVLGEMIQPDCAREITQTLQIPFIGIGCGNECDGQILVLSDVMGMSENPPSFAKVFSAVGEAVRAGAASYSRAVVERQFP